MSIVTYIVMNLIVVPCLGACTVALIGLLAYNCKAYMPPLSEMEIA